MSDAVISVDELDDQLERKHEPLFDMYLRFERVFANKAIDVHDITDEEAERIAKALERHGAGIGAAYAHLMRRVPIARQLRRIHHMVSAVWAAEGSPRALSYDELGAAYAKLRKGDA